MAIKGAAVLAQAGYSPGHIGALAQVSAEQRRDVRVWREGGKVYLSWDYPHGGAGLGHQRLAGITGRYVGAKGAWQIQEPGYRKTTLTEAETRFVLPVRRPGGEVIAFNPFARRDPRTGAVVGTYSYPGMPGRKAEIHVRGLTPVEVEKFTRKTLAGKPIPDLWRYKPEKLRPYGQTVGIASLFKRLWEKAEGRKRR